MVQPTPEDLRRRSQRDASIALAATLMIETARTTLKRAWVETDEREQDELAQRALRRPHI